MVADPLMMSCEPNRCSQYSSDLRWQILWQRIGMEQNFCSIETNLNISVSTACRLCIIFEETGTLDANLGN